MTFFGATTPTFQDEDFNREQAALTDTERVKLQYDMYGFDNDEDSNAIEETPTLIRTSLTLLDEAIDALPYEEKSCYLLAKERVPQLVQEETPPLAFLRCESFDFWAAAKRLCEHWAFRIQVFGHDRAFLPMTLDGAMQQDYEEYVKHPIIFPLDDDIHGRVVLYWDRIRASTVSRDVALRCCLYVVTKLHYRPEFSLKGYVLLINYQACDLRKHYDRALTKQLTKVVATMGAQMKAVHICTGPGRSVAGMLVPVLRKLVGSYMRLRAVIHSGSGSDVLPYFEDYGLNGRHIQVMYGLFSDRLANFQSWIFRQQQIERDGALGVSSVTRRRYA